MRIDRGFLAPITYISGAVNAPNHVPSAEPLSAVPLAVREVSLPGAGLKVFGVEHSGQSLDQHIWSDGTEALAFSGDIYNLELIYDLAVSVVGRRYKFSSVAHLISIVLKHCRERFESLVNGKFVIAFIGAWGCELIRDKMGEEQIYYANVPGGGLAFASSIRSLVSAVPKADFYVPDSIRVFETPVGAETMFRGVHKLEAGTSLSQRNDGNITTRRYWEIRPNDPPRRSRADLAEELKGLLFDSLRIRLPRNCRPSTFLSGGQDSSWINCALQSMGSTPSRAYTTAFQELDAAYNEIPHAKRIADHVGTEHIVLEPDAQDFEDHYPVTMAIFDEVKANHAHFTEYWIARAAAARNDRVLFSGYGADEALGGEVRYLTMYLDRNRSKARELFQSHPTVRNYDLIFNKIAAVPEDTPEADKYYEMMRRGRPEESDEDVYRQLVHNAFSRANRLVDQAGLADIAISGPPLLDAAKVDKFWGVDKVCPFLDFRVTDFAFTLPEESKIDGMTTKSILRDASRGLVPDEITDRIDKVGFAFPFSDKRYSVYISGLADALVNRTGRVISADSSRGRFDRTAMVAASEELVRRSYDEGSSQILKRVGRDSV
ncbi:asparagine synthetase B family protein [Streptomyces sp. NPDC051658]|uniref:asparagine synthetase B family protein n=1 Tax=Streptomyces sp. NPDC051658 TaxID=3365667 RepID=UPI00378F6637